MSDMSKKKKVGLATGCVLLAGAIGLGTGIAVDTNFRNSINTAIVQPIKNYFSKPQQTQASASSYWQENLTQLEKELEQIKSEYADIQERLETSEGDNQDLKIKLNLINQRITELQDAINEIKQQLIIIEDSSKTSSSKLLDLRYGMTVSENTQLGSTTMDFKGRTLIIVGYIYAKVDNHIAYINLRIDNSNEIYELTAFNSATDIMSRPFTFMFEGLSAGTHTFSIEIVGQQGNETITIPNYSRAQALFIEI